MNDQGLGTKPYIKKVKESQMKREEGYDSIFQMPEKMAPRLKA